MKTALLAVLLLSFLILHPRITSAQTTPDLPECEYKEKWEEPHKSQKAFITKDKIRKCLHDEKTIKNHYVVFEDLVEAWKEAIAEKAKESLSKKCVPSPTVKQIEQEETWDLPIKLEGGVLHANTRINFLAFRDQTVTDGSKFTDKELKELGIKKDEPLALIRPDISWQDVFIDSAVPSVSSAMGLTLSGITATVDLPENFSDVLTRPEGTRTIFSGAFDFSGSTTICEYKETRVPVPTNPKTQQPYKSHERNQEPFAGASITKEQIQECLRAEIPIKNHHIVFEDYRDAWQELAKEMSKYDIRLWINGGVLHAQKPLRWDRLQNYVDGIDLKAFSHPKSEGIIRPHIFWENVFLDSGVNADDTKFSGQVSFWETTFGHKASFDEATFSDGAVFISTIFSDEASFICAKFPQAVLFDNAIFSGKSSFQRAIFGDEAVILVARLHISGFSFLKTTFSDEVSFGFATFSRNSGIPPFEEARFRHDADFHNIRVDGTLDFSKTTWEGRLDLRDISAKELRWDSTENPSNVKGVFDLREAQIGTAIFKEVRFQDLVDFSRTTFGQYKNEEDKVVVNPTRFKVTEQSLNELQSKGVSDDVLNDLKDIKKITDLEVMEEGKFLDILKNVNVNYKSLILKYTKYILPSLLFENNTFEKEADLLHVNFYSPAIFIKNRFRSTLDLTGSNFDTEKARLRLSYNRINRLIFEPKNMGNPPGISPYQQFKSLFADPLKTSRVRQIDEPEYATTTQRTSNPQDSAQDEEPLNELYKTLGKSFREANDRTGINESGYLETLAKRENDSGIKIFFSWLLFDVPSRYTVDVWRTLWISVGIMIVFYFIYFLEYGGRFAFIKVYYYCLYIINECPRKNIYYTKYQEYNKINTKRIIKIPEHPKKYNTFKLRLFDPTPSQELNSETSREVNPYIDSALLSMRIFLKLGLDATYPDTKRLKYLTTIEWVLGAYMLVHFTLAVKNSLPFIAQFLGVAN